MSNKRLYVVLGQAYLGRSGRPFSLQRRLPLVGYGKQQSSSLEG